MAKLFGSDYHEHSNTWYFKEKIETYEDDEISYEVTKDESGKYIFRFLINPIYDKQQSIRLKILYNPLNNKIEDHECSICDNDLCKHYLSILQYAYLKMSSNILEQRFIVAYQSTLTTYNEFWQSIKLNSKIIIQDLMDNTTDKVKILFKSYAPIDIFLVAMKFADRIPEDIDEETHNALNIAYEIFSEEELYLIDKISTLKCSVSRKTNSFSLYKKDISRIVMFLKPVLHKVFLTETGERLKISDDTTKINFVVQEIDAYNFILKPSDSENIQAFFSGKRSYILKNNQLYPIDLPVETRILDQIFFNGYLFKRNELVYIATILSRQFSLVSCYIDIPTGIGLPSYYDQPPTVLILLEKDNKSITMKAYLKYNEEALLPLSVINYHSELIEYKLTDKKEWFYISPNLEREIKNFTQNIVHIPYNQFVNDSVYIFESSNEIELLKKNLFEFDSTRWEIRIAEDLKNEFIYRIDLQPVFRINSNDDIDWFTYEMTYEYNDIILTQDELRLHFKTNEKFLRTKEGKLVFITNKEIFDEVENILKKSQKDPDKKYRASLYKLPWIYHLSNLNPLIRIYGDEYLLAMYENLLNRKLPQSPDIIVNLRAIMRSYQKSGFAWIKMLEKYKLNGILADDMGLGKTIQAISVIASHDTKAKHLIVCPKTLLFNWGDEFDKFTPHISYVIYEGSKDERLELLQKSNSQVILCSYAIVQNDLEELQKIKFEYVILDEAQHIKNPNTLRSKSIKKLNSNHKLALTGTPLENNVVELWSIFDFLMPGYLPSIKKFKDEANKLKTNSLENKIQRYISPFILRRKKQEVLIELPDKQEQMVFCQLTPEQESYYVQVLNSVKKDITEAKDENLNYIHLLSALTKLRQICDHPYLIDNTLKNNIELSGKTELLEELITDAIESGKKCLIFSQYISMLKIVKDIMIRNKTSFEYMDGSTQDRQKAIEHFNNNEKVRAFLISLKTGGYGINLTAADTVIIVDPWWNPMLENQAIDRAYRIGQTKKVNVYRLITKGTVEEKIMLLQQNKKDLFENLIEGGSQVLKTLDYEELKKLFEYK